MKKIRVLETRKTLQPSSRKKKVLLPRLIFPDEMTEMGTFAGDRLFFKLVVVD